jgi:hypothetical protein
VRHLISTGYLSLESSETAAAVAIALEAWIGDNLPEPESNGDDRRLRELRPAGRNVTADNTPQQRVRQYCSCSRLPVTLLIRADEFRISQHVVLHCSLDLRFHRAF